MNAYFVAYMRDFTVGKIVVSGLNEDQAKEKALDWLQLPESNILTVKLIAPFAE